jgi:hypothetical protein
VTPSRVGHPLAPPVACGHARSWVV